MARKIQDSSSVSFKAEILYNEKPYTDPLFLITSEKDFVTALSERLQKGDCYSTSDRTSVHMLNSGFRYIDSERRFDIRTVHSLYSSDCETIFQYFCCVSKTINSLRTLYYTCLDDQNDYSEIETVFQILFQSAQYYGSVKSSFESSWSFALSKDLMAISNCAEVRKRVIERDLKRFKVSKYLCSVYNDFVDINAEKTKQFEYSFRQHHNEKYRQSYAHFWNNKDFSSELKELFWDYCRKLPDSETKQILQKRNVRALKNLVLDSLDNQLQKKLEGSTPVISTKEGTIKWNTTSIESAEYLYLFSDLIKRKKYRVCPICGAVFEVDPKYHTKVYCSAHTPSQIQYFNRKRNKQQSKE